MGLSNRERSRRQYQGAWRKIIGRRTPTTMTATVSIQTTSKSRAVSRTLICPMWFYWWRTTSNWFETIPFLCSKFKLKLFRMHFWWTMICVCSGWTTLFISYPNSIRQTTIRYIQGFALAMNSRILERFLSTIRITPTIRAPWLTIFPRGWWDCIRIAWPQLKEIIMSQISAAEPS